VLASVPESAHKQRDAVAARSGPATPLLRRQNRVYRKENIALAQYSRLIGDISADLDWAAVTRQRALQLFPAQHALLALKRWHGRAQSALIALYGALL
jgi:hypothetical protein